MGYLEEWDKKMVEEELAFTGKMKEIDKCLDSGMDEYNAQSEEYD